MAMFQRTLLIRRLLPLAIQTRAAWEDGRLKYPPTDVFNKKWLLRSVLDSFDVFADEVYWTYFSLLDGSTYLLDRQMESPFHKRYEGDHLAEPDLLVGAVVGQIEATEPGSAGFSLKEGARQFVVILPFMLDEPEEGVPGFPWFNQIARTAAAMAFKAQRCGFGPKDIPRTSMIIVTQEDGYKSDSVAKKALIRNVVSSRVHGYREESPECYGALYDWFHEYFLPFLGSLEVEIVHWPSFMSDCGILTPLMWYYFGCLCFCHPNGPMPVKWFTRTIEGMREVADHYDCH
jgi:hypothetical protein